MAPEVRRRHMTAALPRARGEAAVARNAWPAARLLEGRQATKPAVLAAWRHAPRIYVAAHLVRDPEIPFLAFFPMAPAPGVNDPADSYLELGDVRGLDLSGCELVVLSACASGRPYLATGRLGPSMGDVFLDAGAHAVVQTSWPIRDQDARDAMEAFLRENRRVGGNPVRALNAARRAAWGRSDPGTSLSVWSAWSVSVRAIPSRGPVATRVSFRHASLSR